MTIFVLREAIHGLKPYRVKSRYWRADNAIKRIMAESAKTNAKGIVKKSWQVWAGRGEAQRFDRTLDEHMLTVDANGPYGNEAWVRLFNDMSGA